MRAVRHLIVLGACGTLAMIFACSSSDAPAAAADPGTSSTSSSSGNGSSSSSTSSSSSSSGDVDAASSSSSTSSSSSSGDAATPGAPTADALLAKVAQCTGSDVAVKGGFGLDGPGNISILQCGSILHWKADMDVDCDGIQTPPCDTDPQGQPQASIKDVAPHDVDPTLLPYFVIPLGKPETAWYTAHGVALGQVGAVIYKGQVQYGIFADEAGGFFIGEVSYAMCQLFLGKPNGNNDPCSPETGGIDPADITYITFTGATNVAKGQDTFDHAKHVQMGVAAATAWLATP